jgi:dihydrofolate reductase
MKSPKISIICAMDESNGIGKDNSIPWHIKKDLTFFKEKTLGHVVIMGRKTFESIIKFLGKPLPGRQNIVVTQHPDKIFKDVRFVNNIETALGIGKKLEKNGDVFLIGGSRIYDEGLKFTNRLYLTMVKGKFDCDTFFPDYSDFKKVVSEESDSDEGYNFTTKVLERSI